MSSAALLSLALAACETPGPLAEVESVEPLVRAPDQSWYDLGLVYLVAREPAQAERALNRSLAREGVRAETLTALGIAAAQQGLLTKARRHLEQARNLAPEDEGVHNNLGVVLYSLGEYHNAKQAFRTAFVISSGRNEVASQNLAQTEVAIRLAMPAETDNAAISHDVQRLGPSEFRLLEASTAFPVAEGADAGEPG